MLTLFCLSLAGCVTKGVPPEPEQGMDRTQVMTSDNDHKTGSVSTPAQSVNTLAQRKPVDPPKWQVGDRWLWSDGYGLTVIDSSPEWTVFARTDKEQKNNNFLGIDNPYKKSIWYKHQGFFKVESNDGQEFRQVVFRSLDPMQLFPLEPGRSVTFAREYMSNGKLRVHRTSWTVEGWETIQTPAGKFDCIILMMRTRSNTSNWVAFERWWYSPEVRNYVRLEYRYGSQPGSSRVLMSYRLANNDS
ncbi:MAG: hypothetical protein HQL74_13395 [Magnetococcales bacterium]|nr:hypothetical protein [Magnetococcales bacterium]